MSVKILVADDGYLSKPCLPGDIAEKVKKWVLNHG